MSSVEDERADSSPAKRRKRTDLSLTTNGSISMASMEPTSKGQQSDPLPAMSSATADEKSSTAQEHQAELAQASLFPPPVPVPTSKRRWLCPVSTCGLALRPGTCSENTLQRTAYSTQTPLQVGGYPPSQTTQPRRIGRHNLRQRANPISDLPSRRTKRIPTARLPERRFLLPVSASQKPCIPAQSRCKSRLQG
eukprot:m.910735 g.910735  ORF g.910735 m.910735 type:complete len:194 (-) comp60112_c0_seq25:1257-1838(-)